MPLYIYRCLKCSKEKQEIHSMKEEPKVICECSGEMKKVLSRFDFKFKGKLK